jgi:hypothetical protein
VLVDNAQHDGQQRDTEDVVAVCEESCAGNEDGADVVPAKGGLVDFGKGKTPPLVGVLNVLNRSVSIPIFARIACDERLEEERRTAKSLTWL